MAFHRRKHGIESVCPEEKAFTGENAGWCQFVQWEGRSAGQTKKLRGKLKRIVFRTFALTYQTVHIMEYLSKERYDQIVEELNNLINVEYPRIKDDLSEARAQGDLSENFEYRAARRAQGKTISRIRFLQKVLEYSRVLDTAALPKDQVSLLSKVEFTNLSSNARMTYTIVSPHEMDLEKGKISCKSPIGAALMGKKVGDVVDVNAPSGTFQIKIESLSVGQ